MDNSHRVYPVDPSYGPPKYVQLNGSGAIRPPPYRRNVPRYYSQHHHKKRRCGCLRCICCCYCCLIFLVILLLSILAVLYHLLSPQAPSYTVENLKVGSFDVKSDFSVDAEIILSVKAENRNKQISIIYGENSAVGVLYQEKTLCSGKLPAFRQGSENTTMMHVSLKGKATYGSPVHEALLGNKLKGKIPLLVKVKVPITIVLGSINLKQLTVMVNCSLVVDHLSPKEKVKIVSSKYNVVVDVDGWSLKLL